MSGVTIIGCGFVADLYMRSLQVSGIPVLGAYDLNTNRLAAFCHHWGVARCDTLEGTLLNVMTSRVNEWRSQLGRSFLGRDRPARTPPPGFGHDHALRSQPCLRAACHVCRCARIAVLLCTSLI